MTVDKVIAKIIWLTFLAHPVHVFIIIRQIATILTQSNINTSKM